MYMLPLYCGEAATDDGVYSGENAATGAVGFAIVLWTLATYSGLPKPRSGVAPAYGVALLLDRSYSINARISGDPPSRCCKYAGGSYLYGFASFIIVIKCRKNKAGWCLAR